MFITWIFLSWINSKSTIRLECPCWAYRASTKSFLKSLRREANFLKEATRDVAVLQCVHLACWLLLSPLAEPSFPSRLSGASDCMNSNQRWVSCVWELATYARDVTTCDLGEGGILACVHMVKKAYIRPHPYRIQSHSVAWRVVSGTRVFHLSFS